MAATVHQLAVSDTVNAAGVHSCGGYTFEETTSSATLQNLSASAGSFDLYTNTPVSAVTTETVTVKVSMTSHPSIFAETTFDVRIGHTCLDSTLSIPSSSPFTAVQSGVKTFDSQYQITWSDQLVELNNSFLDCGNFVFIWK